ncbi:YEATS-associated helix-containing protein [Aurantivibrio plasticivorans]
MADHIFILAAVMMIAGVFGGLINYYQMNQDDSDPASLPRCIVIGTGASFLVPVVLDLVNSDLILEIQGDPSRLLIYTGFCLIAAIASRFVIVNMSERILREAHLAKTKSDVISHDLKIIQEELIPLIETETENDYSQGSEDDVYVEEELDVTSSRVLKILGCGRYIFRSMAGLCNEAGSDETTMAKTLNVLVGRNLAGKISGKNGVRWYLTDKGRRTVDLLI